MIAVLSHTYKEKRERERKDKKHLLLKSQTYQELSLGSVVSTLFGAISGTLASGGSLGVWFPGKEVTYGEDVGGLSRVGAVGAGGVQESLCACPPLCVSATHFLVALCWVRQVPFRAFSPAQAEWE